MQSGGDEGARSPFFQSLRFRIAALLALSLLPIGLVTVLQTRELAHEVQNRSTQTVKNLTDRATFTERRIIERAFGSAEALSPVLDLLRQDPESCRAYLQSYMAASDRYTFVGFIPPDGVISCSSAPGILEMSDDSRMASRMADPHPWIDRIDAPAISDEPVINVLLPVTVEDVFAGYVTVSTPIRTAQEEEVPPRPAQKPLSLVTFNNQGTILFSETQRGEAPVTPAQMELTDFVGEEASVFVGTTNAGKAVTFSVVPIIPNLVYAVGAWPLQERGTMLGGLSVPPSILPILMFFASIAVAYLAVDRLVVQHISDLRRMMRDFARHRRLPAISTRRALSTELRELEDGFADMALDLSNDEARMEDTLREKNVLLKEIHHRVKNNLQLISSIMNMQIRAADSPETVQVLRRLQERILSLATVHRSLYQAENLSRSNAGLLVSQLFDELMMLGAEGGLRVDFEGDFEDVILYPDQALPLSLLASELATNAIKNVGVPDTGVPFIRASLRLIEPRVTQLVCINSRGPSAVQHDLGSGLGNRLIKAFAGQLGGTLEVTETDDCYTTTLTFSVEEFAEDPADY